MIRKLVDAIQAYYQAMDNGDLKEDEVNCFIDRLEIMLPNARISDLIHHGERLRSVEEIAEEAVAREAIWEVGGDRAVLFHIATQAEQVMNDGGRSEDEKYFAEQVFNDAVGEIERLKKEGMA